MAINPLQTLEIIEVMENFLSRIRPPENIRNQSDIGYTIHDQSIIIFEIRPQWDKPEIIHEYPFAKTTFVKAKNCWKVFWMRANSNWHPYSPQPTVLTLLEFVQLVEGDKHHCFFG